MFKKNVSVILFFVVTFFALQSQSDSSIWRYFSGEERGVAAVNNDLYQEECGACHFTYQPGLLPARSWDRLMSNKELTDHFGEDIAFDDQASVNSLTSYLIKNAADNSSYKRSRKIMRSLGSIDTPLRITDTPYIIRKHREIPDKLITQKEVGSIANCSACHQNADTGSFDDDNVRIPNTGFRGWDND
ncbi:diheme cytochrome c [Candidatus Thioglobus autotrophicus]|uniref:diheme cytochrome c n=1 Tax=Candidatus Thioglobus autotrophicus TaxID=1705394 RepID=UPI00299D5D5E|nr:diheme cytochrome c [Candidatus Thioglobus autotrophicus]WPE18516.1 diheme cytochrome c [Candidatus Thioglobus autotrophicus]